MIALVVSSVGATASIRLLVAARRAAAVDRVRRLHPRAGLPLPHRLRAWLVAGLARADLDVSADDAVRLWLLASVVGAGVGAAVSPALAVPLGLAVLVGGPVGLRWSRGRGDGRVAAALPGALDRVAAGLRAGATVGESLRELATGAGPLAPDLRRLDARTRLGVGLTDGLAQWAAERPVAGVRAVTGALALAVGVGGACAVALEGLGESLRAREAAAREARALSAQTRVSAYVVGGAPLAYLAFVSVTDPGSLDLLLTTNAGRACLVAGLGLEAAGALWMRVLLRGEP